MLSCVAAVAAAAVADAGAGEAQNKKASKFASNFSTPDAVTA